MCKATVASYSDFGLFNQTVSLAFFWKISSEHAFLLFFFFFSILVGKILSQQIATIFSQFLRC